MQLDLSYSQRDQRRAKKEQRRLLCPGDEWKMNGKGVGGSWGLGVATKPRDSISGRRFFWKGCGWGREAGKEHQGEGVFSMSGVQVSAWRDRNWWDLGS